MEWYSSSATPIRSAISPSRRVAPRLLFDLAHRRGDRARLAMHRARRPVELAQRVDHRAADADARIRLEARTAVRRVVRTRPRADPAFRPESGPPRPPKAAGDRPDGRRCASPTPRDASRARRLRALLDAWRVYAPTAFMTRPQAATAGRRTSRSTKNSRFPRGPAGTGHVSAAAASFLNARAAGLEG